MVKKEEKERIIGLINLFVPQAAVYIFGSHARGDATESSDLDIALDQGSKIAYEVLSELKAVVGALYLPYKIDIVDLQRVSTPLKENIIKEHIIWKS